MLSVMDLALVGGARHSDANVEASDRQTGDR